MLWENSILFVLNYFITLLHYKYSITLLKMADYYLFNWANKAFKVAAFFSLLVSSLDFCSCFSDISILELSWRSGVLWSGRKIISEKLFYFIHSAMCIHYLCKPLSLFFIFGLKLRLFSDKGVK